MTEAELYERAAREIETRGHHKGDYGDDRFRPNTCRVCLIGALNAASAGSPFAREVYYDLSALLEVLGYPYDFLAAEWNDAPERTADEVIAVLREAAKRVTS